MHRKIFTFIFLLLVTKYYSYSKTTYAVVVGISDYQDRNNGTIDLRFPDKDAKLFVAFLKTSQGGSVPEENIIQLTNHNATKKNILRAMDLFKKALPQDRIIFYFSGHGTAGSFVPYDVVLGNKKSFLDHESIREKIRASKSLVKLILADACFSGSLKNLDKNESPQVVSKKLANTKLGNVILILSSRSFQESQETEEILGGVFTFYLINGLNGYADTNQDKRVTIKELYDYVHPRVIKQSPNNQSPIFIGNFPDSFILSIIP